MKPSTQKILDHLIEHGSLTPLAALNKFGEFRLAARIHELRGYRWPIETQRVKMESKGSSYANYILDQDQDMWPQ